MNRMSRLVAVTHVTQKNARPWRALWILISLGLVAAGAGAPGNWDIP